MANLPPLQIAQEDFSSNSLLKTFRCAREIMSAGKCKNCPEVHMWPMNFMLFPPAFGGCSVDSFLLLPNSMLLS